MPVSSAEVRLDWDFASHEEALGWSPTHDLQAFSVDPNGLSTKAIGGDPYMAGPSIELDTATVPHIELRMSSTQGSDAQIFWEVDGQPFNEAASQHFSVVADGNWHTYRLDLATHNEWKGRVTRLRLDPSNQAGGDIAIAYIRLLGPLPATIVANQLSTLTAVVQESQPFEVRAVLHNDGDLPAEGVHLDLKVPPDLSLLQTAGATPRMDPRQPITASWRLQGKAGVYPLSLWLGGTRLRQTTVIIQAAEAGAALTLEGPSLRLSFARQPFGYGLGTLAWKVQDQWQVAGYLRSLGHITYLDKAGNERQTLLYAPEGELSADALSFEARHTDEDGVEWTSRVTYQLQPGKPWIRVAHELSTDRAARLLAWTG
ncbi:MAG: hypothetical protein M1546_05610, partial [Chloroflexi bacterium]|nr:hypothetical protein [Chloroflexota bacterium]